MKIKLYFILFFYIVDLAVLIFLYNYSNDTLNSTFTVTHSWFLLISNLLLLNYLFDLRNFLNPFIYFTLNSFMFNFLGNCFTFQVERYQNPKELFLLGSIYMLFVGIGSMLFTFFNLTFVKRQKKISLDHFYQLLSRTNIRRLNVYKVLLAIGVGLIFFHFIFIVRSIPAFNSDAENFRVESKAGKGQFLVFGINFCLLGIIYFVIAQIKKVNFLSIKTFAVIISICLIIMLCGYRSNALQAFVILFIGLQLYLKNYIKYPILLLCILMLFIVIGVTAALRWGEYGQEVLSDANLDIYILLTFSRSSSSNTGMDEVFRYLNSGGDFLYGYSYFLDIITLLPGDQPNFGLWVKKLLKMDFDGGSTMLGDYGIYFINFGYFGVAILAMVNVFILNGAYKYLVQKSKYSLFFFSTLFILSFTFSGIGEIQSFLYYTMIMFFFNLLIFFNFKRKTIQIQ
ncbi:MAG: oligosaccharide repeat unit polymerase [Chitinophagaceae bacterium]|nr:oligosaccharide repeat unit polymerase [Chitinophagaceae bacterium]MCW5904049.1 oligosaccharide repeat unit polymerase [Chitinophagaceae bacterium]